MEDGKKSNWNGWHKEMMDFLHIKYQQYEH